MSPCRSVGRTIRISGVGINNSGPIPGTYITAYVLDHRGHGNVTGCGFEAAWDWNWSEDGTTTYDGSGENRGILGFFTMDQDNVVSVSRAMYVL